MRALLLLTLAATPLVAQDPAWAPQLDSVVNAALARTVTPGASVAIVLDGKLVYAKGYGVADVETKRPVTAATLFRVGSVTKMITGATLAKLAAEGKLDLQAPIGRYIPELTGKVATVTTHQLLTHSAGFADNAVAYGRMGEGALGEVMRTITDTLVMTEPGAVFSYSNPGYSLAGYVAEQTGKGRFADLVDQLIFKPAKMPTSTFRPLQAMTMDFSQGHVGPPNQAMIVRPFTENTAQWAAGFLFASAGEFARFAMLVMDSGRVDGVQVLPPAALKSLTTGHVRNPGLTEWESLYGYGLASRRIGTEPVLAHGGSINGFDADVFMLPARKFAVIIFDNRSGAPLSAITDFAIAKIAGFAMPTPQPPNMAPDSTFTADYRQQLVGRWGNGGQRAVIAESGDGLTISIGGTAMPLYWMGEHRIGNRPAAGGPQLTFVVVRDAQGRVAYLHRGSRAMSRLP